MKQLPDYKVEPPEPKAFTKCDECGSEVYTGEEYYLIDGYSLCDECILEHVKQYKEVAE